MLFIHEENQPHCFQFHFAFSNSASGKKCFISQPSLSNAIKDLEEATIEAKAATVKNEEAVNNAVSELTELIMGILGQSSTNVLVEGTE